MNLTAAFLLLLAQTCPWFEGAEDAARAALVLPPAQFDALAESWGHGPRTTGFAVWWPGVEGPEGCLITLRDPPTAWNACHELQHCVVGQFHG